MKSGGGGLRVSFTALSVLSAEPSLLQDVSENEEFITLKGAYLGWPTNFTVLGGAGVLLTNDDGAGNVIPHNSESPSVLTKTKAIPKLAMYQEALEALVRENPAAQGGWRFELFLMTQRNARRKMRPMLLLHGRHIPDLVVQNRTTHWEEFRHPVPP